MFDRFPRGTIPAGLGNAALVRLRDGAAGHLLDRRGQPVGAVGQISDDIDEPPA